MIHDKNKDQGQVTIMLNHWQSGDTGALEDLMPVIYDELKRLAAAQLRRERNATIQCTELVAEAYLKLVDADRVDWQGRNHFFSIAARTMRRVLVDRYRSRAAQKRGGGRTLLTFNDNHQNHDGQAVELDLLDAAITELEALDPRQADIVVMKFFAGLSGEEIAQVLSISPRTVKREWAAARLWLFQSMNKDWP